MGLDQFSSGESTAKNTRSTGTEQQETEEQNDLDDAFKIISGDRGREKVFHTEEDWQETKEFIESEMGLSMNQVMNMSASDRHDILHQAILGREGLSDESIKHTKECVVCGETFVFPKNWRFERIKGEAVCEDHTIAEAMEAIHEVNNIAG